MLRVLLPAAMLNGAHDEALACVLRHEMAHVRRGDPWLAAAIEVLLVVCWPVVPLWFAALGVRHLMELACDEAALSGADAAERRRYGHVLLDVADHASTPFAAAGSLHDANVVQCVVAGFSSLAFPPPQGGYVTVIYPIEFAPGD